MLFFVKYALINFRSPNQYTISIDLIIRRLNTSQKFIMYIYGDIKAWKLNLCAVFIYVKQLDFIKDKFHTP